MKLYEVQGTYGSHKTPTTIYVAENSRGAKWYAAKGSKNVNRTFDDIEEGVDIETLRDCDTHIANQPINSLEELEEAFNH